MSGEVSPAQKARLETAWTDSGGKTPDGAALSSLARAVAMEEPEVRYWFVRKRKREKKKRQQKKKKAQKVAEAASPSTGGGSGVGAGVGDRGGGWGGAGGGGASAKSGSGGGARVSRQTAEAEIAVTTSLLNAGPSDPSELLYRRGAAYLSMGMRGTQVVDDTTWGKAIADLEAAALLRYGPRD